MTDLKTIKNGWVLLTDGGGLAVPYKAPHTGAAGLQDAYREFFVDTEERALAIINREHVEYLSALLSEKPMAKISSWEPTAWTKRAALLSDGSIKTADEHFSAGEIYDFANMSKPDFSTPELKLSFREEDNDNCRVYFRSEGRRLYCFQLESRGQFQFYNCTSDGEPLAPISLSKVDVTLTSAPPGEKQIGREFQEWYDAQSYQPPTPSM